MAVSFRCARYPTLRVHRGDDTYIEFIDHRAVVYTERDISLLRMCEYAIEEGPDAGLRPNREMLSPPPANSGIVNWWSPNLGVADGYGNSAERMIAALEKTGADVRLDVGFAMCGETTIKQVIDRAHKIGDVRIAYCPPYQQNWRRRHPNQASLGFTMWEDDRVPDPWLESFPLVDAIAAPSRFCEKLFEEFVHSHGIDVPVVYVPLGVQHQLFPYKRRKFVKGNDTFVVMHSATSILEPRKGAKEAYEAFVLAFGDRQDVKLIFRGRFGHVEAALNDPRVELRTGQITEQQKVDILHEAHAFIYPSFGEGFGLIPLEAVATGLPTICSDNTAMSDYRDLVYPVECAPEPSGIWTNFQPESKGNWFRPSVEQMASVLRDMYDNYPRAATFAATAAKAVRAKWGYEHSARALVKAMEVARVSFGTKQRRGKLPKAS